MLERIDLRMGVSFAPSRVVVFVGPNNGGKTTALTELQNLLLSDATGPTKIVQSITAAKLDRAAAISIVDQLELIPEDRGDGEVLKATANNSVDAVQIERKRTIDRLCTGNTGWLRGRLYAATSTFLSFGVRLAALDASSLAGQLERPRSALASLLVNDAARQVIHKLVLETFRKYFTSLLRMEV